MARLLPEVPGVYVVIGMRGVGSFVSLWNDSLWGI